MILFENFCLNEIPAFAGMAEDQENSNRISISLIFKSLAGVSFPKRERNKGCEKSNQIQC